ncbi:MAG: pilus assembly protein PilP [Gammaproteobacteria bacterium]|nr:pilus assembly protein PilP [Gammaproteobacteria bacterium]
MMKYIFAHSIFIRWRHCFVWMAAAVLPGACTDHQAEDAELHQFVAEVKAQKSVIPDKLPAFPDENTHIYKVFDRRAPFLRPERGKDTADAASNLIGKDPREGCLPPDRFRVREVLEQYPLDALKMSGTLTWDGKISGLIIDPDGLIHPIKVNNYLGKNSGKIINITDYQVELMEQIDDGTGTGCFIERESVLALDILP